MSQYILSLLLFVVKNKNQFIASLEIHNVDTRQHTNFHQPTSNLTKYQKGIYYSGVRVYNNLPPHIKDISDDPKNFEFHLKRSLYQHFVYSLEEYFHYKYLLRSPPWRCSPTRTMASSSLRFLDHTQQCMTFSRTPLDKWSACHRDLYLTTHNTHNKKTSMPLMGFEPTISAGEQPQTHALDLVATGTGIS